MFYERDNSRRQRSIEFSNNHNCLIFSNLFSKFAIRNIHDEKLVKIATRAAMGFTPPVGRKSHCGPASDFDKFLNGNCGPEIY